MAHRSQEFERFAEQALESRTDRLQTDGSPARDSPAVVAAGALPAAADASPTAVFAADAAPAAASSAGRKPTTAVTLLRGTSRQLSVAASPNARYASSAASSGFCTSSGKSPYPGLKRPASMSKPRPAAACATRSCNASAAASASAEHAASYSNASVALNAVRRCSSCSRCAPSVTAISAQCVAPSRKRTISSPGSSKPAPRTRAPGEPAEPAAAERAADAKPDASTAAATFSKLVESRSQISLSQATEPTARAVPTLRAAAASPAACSPSASPPQRSRGKMANTPAGGFPASQAERAACRRSSSDGSIDCPA